MIYCNDLASTVQILSALGSIPLTVLFFPKLRWGKGLYTLKGGHSLETHSHVLPQAMWDSMECKIPPSWVTTIHPPYGHTRPRAWGPHFWLGHGSDTICNNLALTVQILSTLGSIPFTVLFFPRLRQGKGLYTLKGDHSL